MSTKKIIVLVPVKNEAWILERFLSVCSIFADHIIIADQNSSDGSTTIYQHFPKATVINNTNKEYNEADRQLLLIQTARERFGLNNILLAIDADEILSANAMQSNDWQLMLKAKPGTILYFEKPTLLKDTSTAIRYLGGGWPLGYVDDGAEHTPTIIHSTRVPTPAYADKLYLNDIKFLHYALVRLDAQASKQRMYSIVENLKSTRGIRRRRRAYNSQNDFSKEGDVHEPSNPQWFKGWEDLGVDMHTINTSDYYWYDYEALRIFNTHGTSRFLFDDIWDFNWEACRLKAIENNYGNTPLFKINHPFLGIGSFIGRQIDLLDYTFVTVKALLKTLRR